jgi:hypothetical protein
MKFTRQSLCSFAVLPLRSGASLHYFLAYMQHPSIHGVIFFLAPFTNSAPCTVPNIRSPIETGLMKSITPTSLPLILELDHIK